MQTRKRAKSITFGKPKKEEEVKPQAAEEEKVAAAPAEEKTEAPAKEEVKETKETPEEHEEKHELTEAAKKVADEEPEEKPAETKDTEDAEKDEKEEKDVELSDKLTTEDESSELSATPSSTAASDDFITDTTPDKEDKEEEKSEPKEESKSEESTGLSAVPEPSLSTPVLEPEPKSDTPSTASADLSPASEELSATPPQSAFSLQEGGDGGGESGGKKRNFFVYFLVIALFSFILGIGAMAVIASGLIPGVSLPKELPFASQMPQIASNPSPTSAPTQAPQPTVEPTDKPVDLTAYTISVLNGSGIRGKAADVRASLTEAGFKVSSTGNAASNDFEATQISAKKDVDEAYIKKLQEELGKEFKVEVAAAPAPASQATDVVVTIGSDTAN
jgi:hypothetical protein